MLIAVCVLGVAVVVLAAVCSYLLVCNEQGEVDAHDHRVRLDGYEKRIATLERAEGVGDDAFMETWRRMQRKDG